MSTRFYFGSDVPLVIPTSWSAGWNSIDPSAITRSMGGSNANTGSFVSLLSTLVVGNKIAAIRVVGPKLSAQTLTGTFKGQLTENCNPGTAMLPSYGLKVIKSDGTDRAIIQAPFTSNVGVNESAQLRNLKVRDGAGQVIINIPNTVIQDDDRIVFEMGMQVVNVIPGNGAIQIVNIGSIVDAPEDDTTITGVTTWIEFSQDIILKEPIYIRSSPEIPNDSPSSTNASSTLTFVPPRNMRPGALCVVFLESVANTTWSNAISGGQTWFAGLAFSGAAATKPFCRMFWCFFNGIVNGNGDWPINPRFDSTSATGTSGVLHSFMPGVAASTWQIDVNQVTGTFTAPASPFSVVIPAIVTINPNAIVIAGFFSGDDNAWTSQYPACGRAQVRNLASTDMSMTQSWFCNAVPGNTGTVSAQQTALGGDAGVRFIMSWSANAPVDAGRSFGFIG